VGFALPSGNHHFGHVSERFKSSAQTLKDLPKPGTPGLAVSRPRDVGRQSIGRSPRSRKTRDLGHPHRLNTSLLREERDHAAESILQPVGQHSGTQALAPGGKQSQQTTMDHDGKHG